MTGHKTVGDPIAVGDILAHPNEPDLRWARLVAIRKDDCREIERYIMREFVDGDGAFPTGGHRTTSYLFCIAWEGWRRPDPDTFHDPTSVTGWPKHWTPGIEQL